MTASLPPESILANTADILKACEIAEISSTQQTNDSPSFHLVTQLACLLLLGKYNHARHLWRRYNAETLPDTEMENPSTTTKTGRALDLYQFQLLWKAAQPLLQSYFGNVSLLDSSKELFVSLQSCVDANLYPLSFYSKELIEGLRSQMTSLIETVYDTIQEEKCKSLLGVAEGGQFLNQLLEQRGWKKQEGSQVMWIPNSPGTQVVSSNEQNNKIELLSNVVGFMEKKSVQL